MVSARVLGHPGFNADGFVAAILDQENAPEKEHPQASGGATIDADVSRKPLQTAHFGASGCPLWIVPPST
jgi:hypothetical protein